MSLELNKAAAAVLTAGLVAMGSGFLADLLVHPEELEENAYQIAVAEGGESGAEAEEPGLDSVLPLLAGADLGKGESLFRACGACHSIEAGGANKVGPNLHAIVGKQIASVDGFSYSDALASHPDEVWGYEELNAFLAKPKDYAPGTKMSYGGMSKVEDRANLIAWLRTQGSESVPLPSPEEMAASEEGPSDDPNAAESPEAPAGEAEQVAEAPAASGIMALVAAADPAAGEKAFNKCKACHTVDKGGASRIGPNLYGIIGHDVAAVEGFKYSDAMKSHGGTWTIERLSEFLADPRGVVSGTRMTFAGVKGEEERAALIRYLREQSDNPAPLE